MVKNSIFQDNGYAIFAGAANILGSSLLVEGNTFNDIAESAITFTTNTTIDQNTFTNICTVGTDCAAITNTLGSADGSNITNNVIMNVGTGILSTGSHDGIRLTSPAFATNISGNTISNAMRSIVLTDVYGTTVTNNTLFHPRTEALLITETIINATQTNTISNNTITAYNPDYSMIKIDDQVDAS